MLCHVQVAPSSPLARPSYVTFLLFWRDRRHECRRRPRLATSAAAHSSSKKPVCLAPAETTHSPPCFCFAVCPDLVSLHTFTFNA